MGSATIVSVPGQKNVLRQRASLRVSVAKDLTGTSVAFELPRSRSSSLRAESPHHPRGSLSVLDSSRMEVSGRTISDSNIGLLQKMGSGVSWLSSTGQFEPFQGDRLVRIDPFLCSSAPRLGPPVLFRWFPDQVHDLPLALGTDQRTMQTPSPLVVLTPKKFQQKKAIQIIVASAFTINVLGDHCVWEHCETSTSLSWATSPLVVLGTAACFDKRSRSVLHRENLARSMDGVDGP